MAEGVGFEPTGTRAPSVFKTDPFGHSGTPPRRRYDTKAARRSGRLRVPPSSRLPCAPGVRATPRACRIDVLWDVLWGVWNGATSFGLLVLHVFDAWERSPVYNVGRDGGWYQFGFILGVLMTGGGSGGGAMRLRKHRDRVRR